MRPRPLSVSLAACLGLFALACVGCLDTSGRPAGGVPTDALPAADLALTDAADGADPAGSVADASGDAGPSVGADTAGGGEDLPPAEPCDQPGATRCSADHASLEFCGGAELSWSPEFAAPCGEERCFDSCDAGADVCEIGCQPRYDCSSVLECVAACITRFDGDFTSQSACEHACQDQATAEQRQLYEVLDLCSNEHACRTAPQGQIACLFSKCTELIVECTVVEEGAGDCADIASCAGGCSGTCEVECAGTCAADPGSDGCGQCVSVCEGSCNAGCFGLGTKDAQIQALEAFLCAEGLDCSGAPSTYYCTIDRCGEGLIECSYGGAGSASCVDTGQCLAQCSITCGSGNSSCYGPCQDECLAAATAEGAVDALLVSACLQTACPVGGVVCIEAAMAIKGECRDDFLECCNSAGKNLLECKFF